jgi:23S rRNA pseudouridine1911/1915/1917 synthase
VDVRIGAEHEGARLDVALAARFPELSRTRLQTLIRDRQVHVNGRVVSRAGERLREGDRVEVTLPPPVPAGLQPEAIPLDVVYEDGAVLIVNKPAGLVVHPAAGHATGTLVHAALAHAPDLEGIGGELRPGVVHRLDKDTSGLIILAKNERALAGLQQAFKARSIRKTYLAVVEGHPPTPSGRVEAPIGRDPAHRKRMAVVPGSRGRIAQTAYRTLETFAAGSLLEVHPETGRTHQIRVHLAFLGCPVAGDRVYAARPGHIPAPRHMLHAWKLRLHLPGEPEAREFEAPLPPDFQHVLLSLRREGAAMQGPVAAAGSRGGKA